MKSVEVLITEFWVWFLQNGFRLKTIQSSDEPLFRFANAKIREIDQRLGLLFSEMAEPREVIISANGKKDAFELVEEIVQLAPAVDGWKVIAFKPARGFPRKTKYGGVNLVVSDLWVIPLKKRDDTAFFGLQVAIPGFDGALYDEFRNCIYEVLEIALGERQFYGLIDYVDVGPMPASTEGWGKLVQLERIIELER